MCFDRNDFMHIVLFRKVSAQYFQAIIKGFYGYSLCFTPIFYSHTTVLCFSYIRFRFSCLIALLTRKKALSIEYEKQLKSRKAQLQAAFRDLLCARRRTFLTDESPESARQWEGYSRTSRVSIVRWNLKEDGGKTPV